MRHQRASARVRGLAAAAAIVALAAALVFGTVPAAFAKQSLGLSSADFKFEAKNGQVGKGEVFLTNEGDQKINVLIYAADQKVDDKGVRSYKVPNRDTTTNYLDSPAMWVQLDLPKSVKALGNTPYIELSPGERVPVRFAIEIPGGAVPGDKQIMLFFEMFEMQKNLQGVSSRVSGRLGARIVARISGEITEQVDVLPFIVPQFVIGDSADYNFTVKNGSNVDKRVSSTLSVLDRNESESAKVVPFKDTVVFAGSNLAKSGTIKLSGLAPGLYTVRLTSTYSRESLQAAPGKILKTRQLWLVPLWLAVGVAALIVLALVWIIWRMGSRSARRKMDREKGAAEAAAPVPAASASGDAGGPAEDSPPDQAAG